MLHDLDAFVSGDSRVVMPNRDRAMTSLLRLFGEARSRKEYLDAVIELLRGWSGCRRVGVRVLDRDGNIPFESHLGYSQEFVDAESWLSVEADSCICTRVIKGAAEPSDAAALTSFGSFRCGQSLDFVAQLTPVQRTSYRGTCMRMGFASLAVVPIAYHGKILGAIHIADERKQKVPDHVVEFIETVAPLVGEAVHRFGLEEELRRKSDAQAAINSLLRLSLQDVPLDETVRSAREILRSISWLSFEPDVSIELLEGKDDALPPPAAGYHQVPIRSKGATLGQISLRIKDGARRRSQDEETVSAVADVLAGIVMRAQTEERLARAQRLEMAGRVAGQVAHDLNNLLSPLIGYPQLIKRQLSADHPATRYCDIQIGVAKQMAAINEDLLTLGRRGRLKLQPIDVNSIVSLAVAQLEQLPLSVEMDVELAENLPQVSGAAAQLLRVVSNLINNAQEAMDSGGTLTVHTELVRLDNALDHYAAVVPGEYVRLTVADTGCGIPEEIIDSIFDPFFTTKQTTRKTGSGLGLSVVQAILEDHRGYVDVESEVGKGTTFSIYLPTV